MLDISTNSLSDLSMYDINVQRYPMSVMDPAFFVGVPTNMGYAVVRDNSTVLGVVGPRTKLHPYKDTCEVVNEALSNDMDIDLSNAKVTNQIFNSGAYMKRTIEFPNMSIEPTLNDIVNFSIVHYDSYNMKWATQIIAQPRRLVCLNGQTTSDYTIKFYSKHSSNDPVSLKEFSATLEEAVIDFQKQEGKFKTMISTPLNVEQAHNFIKTFCLSPTKIDPNNYSKPMYNKLLSSYEKEEKLSGNTVYTLYNALTRWGTHAETKGQQHTVERHRNARIAQALRSKEWKELGQLKLIEY